MRNIVPIFIIFFIINNSFANNKHHCVLEHNSYKIQYEKALKFEKNQNYHEAAKLYEKSAIEGYVRSQHQLALLYDGGYLIKKENNEAIKWHTLAAKCGHAGSQSILSLFYLMQPTPDLIKAYAWSYLASLQGRKNAKQINADILKQLSKNDLETAQKIALKYKKDYLLPHQ